MDDRDRGDGKTSKLYEPPESTVIPPKMTYRFPPVLFHLSRGVDHAISTHQETSRGTRAQVRRLPRLFHQAIRASIHYL